MLWRWPHLCGDQFDEGEDGSDVSGRRGQLQTLGQETTCGGMGPKVQPAPDEHQVPARGRTGQRRRLHALIKQQRFKLRGYQAK